MIFDLSLISKYRAQLMGVAMLWIIFFHTTLDVELQDFHAIYTIKRLANFGVDLFMLVSGLGIYYSWKYSSKNSVTTFYKRRFTRILPMYLIFITIYSIYIILMHNSPISVWAELASTSQFWSSSPTSFWKFWYIPAILFMYIISPIFLILSKNNLIKGFTIWASILFLISLCGHTWGHTVMYSVFFPLRCISFLFGIVLGNLIEKKTVVKNYILAIISLISILLFTIYYLWIKEVWLIPIPTLNYLHDIKFWLAYTLLTPVLAMMICKILSLFKDYKYPILTFFGTYSLSLYLWHQPLMQGIDTMIANPYLSNLISFALTIPVAYIFQKTVYYLTDKVFK